MNIYLKNKPFIKLHIAIDLITGGLVWYDLTSGSTHDSKCFSKIISGFLYIFVLGYWSIELLNEIQIKNGFFLSRVKGNASITVTKIISGWTNKRIIGRDLLSFPILNKRGTLLSLLQNFLTLKQN